MTAIGEPFRHPTTSVVAPPRTAGWQETYAKALVAVDFVAVVLAVALAQWLRFGGPLTIARPRGRSANWAIYFSNYLVVSLLIVIGWMLVLSINRSRASGIVGSGIEEYRRVWSARPPPSAASPSSRWLSNRNRPGLPADRPAKRHRAAALFRWLARRTVFEATKAIRALRHADLVVGNQSAVRDLARSLTTGSGSEYEVVGACIPGRPMRTQLDIAGVGTIPTFGDESDIVAAAVESNSFAVAVTASEYLDGRALRELSWELDGLNIDMFVAPGVIDVAGPRLQMRPIAGMSLIHVEKPTYHGAKQFEKRLFDVMFSSLVLICGLPILVLIALAIKLTSPGPVFYRQERIGADGRPFRMIKFRTMVDGADKMLGGLVALNDSPGGVLFKMHSDPRVTPVGRILRKYSLDELPQFINVLKRDMSVVGPRPPLAREVATYDDCTRRRLLVRPGITGLWQVSGRSDLNWEDSVRLDLFYVENWSMISDLLIAVKTVKAIVSPVGAY